MKIRADLVYANRDNWAQWVVSASTNVLPILFPGKVLLIVCLLFNLIYFVTAQWLSFQSVRSYFNERVVQLPQKVRGLSWPLGGLRALWQ